jgi:lipoyl-dependent peroxiredoxin
MPTTTSEARWDGNLEAGSGTMKLPSQGFEGPYTRASRFTEEGEGSNPEELLGAAHAGCFSMFLSGVLSKAGTEPTSITTTAKVRIEVIDSGPTITKIALATVGVVPGITQEDFQAAAEQAKAGCPVSKALAGVAEVTLEATLQN